MGRVTLTITVRVRVTVLVWLGLILSFTSFCTGDEVADGGGGGREALEIIIGGGGYGPSPAPDCPPPPPPPEPVCPPPPPPPPPVVPVCPTPSPPPSPRPPHSPPPPPPTPRHSPPPPPHPRPPTPSPAPPRFENALIEASYRAILKFKKKIFYDPKGYTKTWNPNEGDVCNKFRGYACDRRPDNNKTAVASIDFNGANFAGKDRSTIDISEFLEDMVDLAIVHVNSNNFSGTIPELSKLKYLYEFDISNNRYSGKFPDEVLRATNISFLDLRFNSFSGTVPPAIFKTPYDVLFINNNNFKSTLPNLKSNTTLYLTFANNDFTGPIPRSIGEASKLLEVLFLNNSLSGCLPYEIGNLGKATVFDAGFNDLTGPIPHSFSCLKKMELLSLASNRLYGAVPETVCGLPGLTNLTLSHNYFTQVGTKCRGLIKRKVLDLRMNCIRGLGDQRSEEECNSFFNDQPLCPDPRSFFYVPCENLYDSEDGDEEGSRAAPVRRSPRAYEALAPSG